MNRHTESEGFHRLKSFITSARSDALVKSAVVGFVSVFGTANVGFFRSFVVEDCIRKGFVESVRYLCEIGIVSRCGQVFDFAMRNSGSDEAALVWARMFCEEAGIELIPALGQETHPHRASPPPHHHVKCLVHCCHSGFISAARYLYSRMEHLITPSIMNPSFIPLIKHAIRGGQTIMLRWLLSPECEAMWPNGDVVQFVWARYFMDGIADALDTALVYHPQNREIMDLLLSHSASLSLNQLVFSRLFHFHTNLSLLPFTSDHASAILRLVDFAAGNVSSFTEQLSHYFVADHDLLVCLAKVVNRRLSPTDQYQSSVAMAELVRALIKRFPETFTQSFLAEYRSRLNENIANAASLPPYSPVFMVLGWVDRTPRILDMILKALVETSPICPQIVEAHIGCHADSYSTIFGRVFELPFSHEFGNSFVDRWEQTMKLGQNRIILQELVSLYAKKLEEVPSDETFSLGSRIANRMRSGTAYQQSRGLSFTESLFVMFMLRREGDPTSTSIYLFRFGHPDFTHAVYRHYLAGKIGADKLYDSVMSRGAKALLVWYTPQIDLVRWLVIHYRSMLRRLHHDSGCTKELVRTIVTFILIRARGTCDDCRIVLGPKGGTQLHTLPMEASARILSYCWFNTTYVGDSVFRDT